MSMLAQPLLVEYEGMSIPDICPHGFDDPQTNHCAHFVAHVLQLSTGMTCARLRGVGNGPGAASVRVHEVFAECPDTREVLECPTTGTGLVFVSGRTNFRGTPVRMNNVPKKHVGIVCDGMVWHYSNTRDRVIKQPVSQFLFHYPRQSNSIWWGRLPASVRPTSPGTSS